MTQVTAKTVPPVVPNTDPISPLLIAGAIYMVMPLIAAASM